MAQEIYIPNFFFILLHFLLPPNNRLLFSEFFFNHTSNEELIYSYDPMQISYDIVQDILEQGDCLSDTLKGLQDVVSLTKVLH